MSDAQNLEDPKNGEDGGMTGPGAPTPLSALEVGGISPCALTLRVASCDRN